MSERSPVRVGIIGAGAISQVVHLPILTERPDVDVVALADADVHKAETLSRRFDVPVVMDAADLPITSWLIDHPDGLVLFDTGNGSPSDTRDSGSGARADREKERLLLRMVMAALVALRGSAGPPCPPAF